jgi:Uncharacterized protein family, UPF0114
MVGLLLKLRWMTVVIAVFCAIHALAFIGIGVMRGIEGYRMILAGPPWPDLPPGVQLGKSVDAFLLGMVFLVVSIGVTTLFLARPNSSDLESVPAWMRVRNLAELKFLIWEAILAALVVACVEVLVVSVEHPAWTALVLPAAVLVLAAGLFLARKAH